MPFITDEDIGVKPRSSAKAQFISDEDLKVVAPSPVLGQAALPDVGARLGATAPTPPEQTYFSDIIPQYKQEVSEAQQRFTKPESNVIDKILGTFQYVASPVSALTRPLLGEPTQRGLQAAGVPEPIAKYGGVGAEFLIPTGPFAVGKTAQLTKAKAISAGLKSAYGVNLPDPASLSKLQIQNQNFTAWEKFIGPKFDTVSDRIGGFLQRFGLADNLSKQQQTIKQFRIKKRQLKGEISDRFVVLKNRIEELPLEEQSLFEESLGLDVPTGNQNVDSLISDIRNSINEVSKGIPVVKEIIKKVASKAAPDEIPLYHGTTTDVKGDLIKSIRGDFGPGLYFTDNPRDVHLLGSETLGAGDDAPTIYPAYFKGKAIDSNSVEFKVIGKKYGLNVPPITDKNIFSYTHFVKAVKEKFKPISSDDLVSSQQIANHILSNEKIDAIKGHYGSVFTSQFAILNPKAIRYLDEPIFDTKKENVLLNLEEEAPGLLGVRGITKTIDADELDLYKEYGFKRAPGNKPNAKQIRINRKFTKDELGQLSELDTGANYIANIGKSLANDVSAFQFYDDISKHFINNAPTSKAPGYRKVSEKKIRGTDLFRKGTLAGKYVPESLADDLEYTDDIRGSYANVPFIKQYIKANQQWKVLKTAWNPKVHFGNFISSAINFDLIDARKRTLITAAKEISNKKSLYRLAEQHGVFKGGYVRTESDGLSKDALEMFINTIQHEKDLDNNNIINTGVKIADKFKTLAINSNSKLLSVYNLEDDIFKFAIFIDRINKGYKPVDAATDSRVLGIDYDIQAPVINILRDTAHPFISYPYRIIPRLTEAAVKHPVKFGKWAVLGYALQQALTDDEQGSIELLPERQKQTALGIPGAPSTLIKVGKDKVVNVQRLIPGGNIFDVPDFGVPLLPQPLQPSGGLAGSLSRSFVQGRDQFGEKLLESPTSQLSKLGTRAESFLESNVPNIPGVPYAPSTKQLTQAASGQYSPYQDPKTITQAALGTIGIDIINLDKRRLTKVQEKTLKNDLTVIGQMEYKLRANLKKGLISQDNYVIEQLKLANERILLKAKFRDKTK